MTAKRISVDVEESLYRRFRAKIAYEDASINNVLGTLIGQWVGTWGSNFFSHTVAAGEDLRSIASQYYCDPELYWAIAHFNDIAFPVLLQPGQQILIPEPGTSPTSLASGTTIPWGVPKNTVSLDVDPQLHRRFKARAAFEGTSMTARLYDFVVRWTSDWPSRTVDYTVQAGDTLGGIAFRFYSDTAKYWVMVHFNGIREPALIRCGQQLIIPEPLTSGELPAGESPYIFGIHDSGGQHLMAAKGKKGWVLITERIFRNPHDHRGEDYTDLETQGFGVIVRLNHDYHPSGTIPWRDADGQNYQDFAVRCGNFVENSPGCHIWIIGNEMNHPNEWPRDEDGQAQMITPAMYADCYNRSCAQIHRRPGHEDDQVVIGAVAPWNANAKYGGNERGDWVKYLEDVLALVRNKCDGIALHTYTHGHDQKLITALDRMESPFQDRYFQFLTYREFMDAIPASMRGLPVYITETDQNDPWARKNTGWVQAAYAEIDDWNQDPTHQRIRCLLLYRWEAHSGDLWHFSDVPEVQDDFRAALDHDYRWWQ